MIKLDKDRNVTQEYLDYVSSLKRKDLETFYIGADLYVDKLKRIIEDINSRIEQRMNENISDELKIELRNIELIANGTIKVVRDGE